MNLREVRCAQPAGSYKTGTCGSILFRVSSTGGFEVKCHRCHRVYTLHRSEIHRYAEFQPLAWEQHG